MRLLKVITSFIFTFSACHGSCPESTRVLDELLNNTASCSAEQGASCTELCEDPANQAYFHCNETIEDLQLVLNSFVPCPVWTGCLTYSLGMTISRTCASSVTVSGTLWDVCSNGELDVLNVTGPDSLSTGESDVDCGGPFCARCEQGQLCRYDSDCKSGLACGEIDFNGDGVKRGIETGGTKCTPLLEAPKQELENFFLISALLLIGTGVFSIGIACYQSKYDSKISAKQKRLEEKHEAEKRRAELSKMKKSRNTTANETSTDMPAVSNSGFGRKAVAAKVGKDSIAPPRGLAAFARPNSAKSPFLVENEEKKKASGSTIDHSMSLEELLAVPDLREMFHDFIKDKHASENIDFWEEINAYEALFDSSGGTADLEQAQTCGRAIAEKYIVDGSATQINLAHEQRRTILATLLQSKQHIPNAFKQDTFRAAKNDILNLVNNNFYYAFLMANKAIEPEERTVLEVV